MPTNDKTKTEAKHIPLIHDAYCKGTVELPDDKNCEACGHLAAHSDLLAAAKNVLEWMELALPKFDGPLDVGNATHQIALRAAIAKASGQ